MPEEKLVSGAHIHWWIYPEIFIHKEVNATMENPKKHQEIMNSAFPKGIAGSCNRISPLSSLQLYPMSCPHLTWGVSDSWGRILCRNTHLICLCTSVKMSPTKLRVLGTWKMLSSSKTTPLLLILVSFPTHSVWNQYKVYLNDCSGTPPPDPVWTPQKMKSWQKYFSGHLSQPQQGWLYFASSISLIYFLLPMSLHLSFNPAPKKI